MKATIRSKNYLKIGLMLLIFSGALQSIAQPLSANAGTNTSICAGSNLTLGGSPTASYGTPPYTYSWSPATGLSSTTVANPTASPSVTTTYTLTVTDAASGTANAAIIVNVNPMPNAISTPSSQTICSGNTTSLSLSSGVGGATFTWTVVQSGVTGASTGSGSAIVQSLTATGVTAGTATYTITSSANGCVGSPITAVVTVNPAPSITSSGSAAICSGSTLTLPITSDIPSTYVWGATDNSQTTGESTTTQTSGTINNTITSSAPVSTNINYTVQATSLAGCAGSFYPVTVTVNSIPVITASPSSYTMCSGSTANISFNSNIAGTTYTYTYSPSGVTGGSSGTSGILQTLTTTGASPGTATYIITGTHSGCTSNTINASVTVNPLPTVTVNSPSICMGNSVTLTSSVTPAGGTYSWSPGGGTSASFTVTPASTTTYTCTYTQSGCTNIGSGTVTVNPNPTVNAGADQTVCLGTPVTFNATSNGIGFSWTFGDGGSSPVLSPSYTYTTPGTYSATLAVTGAGGCTANDNVNVIVRPNPISTTTYSNVTCNGLCNGAATTSPSGGAAPYSYYWNNSVTGPSITGVCAGYYDVAITDANGCMAYDTVIITQPTLLAATVSSTDVTCNGACDGTANVMAAGGVPPYTYLWSPSGVTNQNWIGICPGSYTVTVTDSRGCTSMGTITVTQPTAFTAAATSTQTICMGGDATLTGTATGGSTPYSFGWTDGSNNFTGAVLLAGPIVSTSYTLTATDNSGCISTANTSIIVLPPTDIYGHVTYSGGSLSTGTNTAVAYQYSPTFTSFDTLQVTTVDASGNFHFTALASNSIIIKVFNDTALHPLLMPTYFGNQYLWDSATVIIHDCTSADTTNITMQEVPMLTGPGTISGTITEGMGFTRMPGEPIPGIDIKLGRNPGGGALVASTETGTGANIGQYRFSNIPVNAPGENYVIYVDIPGLGRVSTYSFVIDAGHTDFNGLDYEADSTSVYITQLSVGVNNTIITDSKMSVYPNPAKDNAKVEYTLNSDAVVSLDVYNVLGVKTASLVSAKQSAGKYIFSVSTADNEMQAGIYFVTLTINGKAESQRLIITK